MRAAGTRLPLLFAVAFLAAAFLVGLLVGPVHLGAVNVVRATFAHVFGFRSPFSGSDDAILWQLRLPRVILGAIVGGTLAAAGAAYQGVFRNPLADPYLLGAAAGAALTPGARAVVLASRPPRLILARCAAPARRLGRGGGVRPSVVLADPAAGAAGRGDPAAAARSTTAQGPTRRPVRAPAVPPATGRPPGTVSGARAGREGTAPAWLVAVRNIWVTHASSLCG